MGVDVYANAEDLLHGGGFPGRIKRCELQSYLRLEYFGRLELWGLSVVTRASIPPVRRADGECVTLRLYGRDGLLVLQREGNGAARVGRPLKVLGFEASRLVFAVSVLFVGYHLSQACTEPFELTRPANFFSCFRV
jgi:hypothetical protein